MRWPRLPSAASRAERSVLVFERVEGDAISRQRFDEVDRLAFSDGYTGQHDVALGRRGVAVRARRGGATIGYALALPLLGAGGSTNKPWVMDTVAVVPTHQSEGLGTTLLCRAAALLDQLGVGVVLATPLGGADEGRRRVWLESLGFRQGERGLEASTSELGARLSGC